MTSEYKEKLQAYGVNLDSALNRFMDNEQFYERILSKFPMDENFILMERSLNENNISQAFRHAHTLKGLAATLDLTNISDILIPMTEKLRAGESEGIQDLFDQLKVQYKLICDLITGYYLDYLPGGRKCRNTERLHDSGVGKYET